MTFLCGGNLSAQTVQPRPVARLVSTSADTSPVKGSLQNSGHQIVGSASLSLEAANSIERRAFEQTNAVRIQHGLQPFFGTLKSVSWPVLILKIWPGSASFPIPPPTGSDKRPGTFGRNSVPGHSREHRLQHGYDDPGAFAVERWMISPGHRANILSAGFTSMAVGTFVAADGSVFLTQTFIKR